MEALKHLPELTPRRIEKVRKDILNSSWQRGRRQDIGSRERS